MQKKILAIIALTAMLVTMIPTVAFADESAVATIGDTEYSSLQAAFKAAKSGDTINLLKDITLDQDATYDESAKQNGYGKYHHYAAAVVNGKDVTFNMNNHSIELNFDENGITGSIGGSSVILVQGNSSLTITGSGTMSATGAMAVIWAQAIDARIIIENGTFKNNDGIADVIYADAGGEIYVKGGTFGSPLLVDKRLPGDESPGKLNNKNDRNCDGTQSKIVITGGTFSEDPVKCAVVNAKDGESECNAVAEGYSVVQINEGLWNVHKHEFSDTWTFDGKEHWNECSSCTEKKNVAAHFDTNNDSKCDKCGYDMTAKVPAGDKGNKNNTGTTADNSQVETGDNFNPVIFGGIALMAIIAMAAVVMTRRRHN